MHSSGFFVLAYAAPPDFANTSLITSTRQFESTRAPPISRPPILSWRAKRASVSSARPSTAPAGCGKVRGIASAESPCIGDSLLVLKGSCDIEGVTIAKDKLVVGKVVTPRSCEIAASTGSTCLAIGGSVLTRRLGPRLPSTLRRDRALAGSALLRCRPRRGGASQAEDRVDRGEKRPGRLVDHLGGGGEPRAPARTATR